MLYNGSLKGGHTWMGPLIQFDKNISTNIPILLLRISICYNGARYFSKGETSQQNGRLASQAGVVEQKIPLLSLFLAVQNSSIGDLVTHWLTHRTLLIDIQKAILETCDLWDICSEWWEDMTWPKKLQIQRHRQRQKQRQRQRHFENTSSEQS